MISSNEQQDMLQSLIMRSGNYFEQARTMQTLCAECGYTQASLSKRLNVSQSYVGNKIRLLQYSAAEIGELRFFSYLDDKESGTVVIWEVFDFLKKNAMVKTLESLF